MNMKGNTVLITGGTSGIGMALAERFLADDNTVIICGRSEERLLQTQEKLPGLHLIHCDVSEEEARLALFDRVRDTYSDMNILINNAGIQQRFKIMEASFAECRQELATNLDAPIHLSILFAPFLAGRENAHIVNVTSGLAFMPPIWAPVYGATKAGLHSFTFTMRAQLESEGVRVVEVIPPRVQTNLGGPSMQGAGVDLDAFADAVYAGFARGDDEVGFEDNLRNRDRTRAEIEDGALAQFRRT